VSGLLPTVLSEAVRSRSVSSASQSFGLVALVLAIALLTELEVIRLIARRRRQLAFLTVLAIPLLVVFGLTAAARVALLVR
jgi:membrane-associated HD superfamily phosphohydrolase